MNREQKKAVIKELGDNFLASQALFLVGYKGLSVFQMQSLRRELVENGASLRVAKARLMKRAVEGSEGLDQLAPFMKDQIGVIFSQGEPPVVAKVMHTFSKNNEDLKLIAGLLEGKVLDKKSIERIALLPTKDVLLTQVCIALNAPITQIVSLLNASMVQLAVVLKQIGEKKGEVE